MSSRRLRSHSAAAASSTQTPPTVDPSRSLPPNPPISREPAEQPCRRNPPRASRKKRKGMEDPPSAENLPTPTSPKKPKQSEHGNAAPSLADTDTADRGEELEDDLPFSGLTDAEMQDVMDNDNNDKNDTSTPATPTKDAEAERQRLAAMAQQIGSPDNFNPHAHITVGQWTSIYEGLVADGDDSRQFQAVLELADNISVLTEESLQTFRLDQFVPALVKLLDNEYNPDLVMLVMRSLYHLLDSFPGAGATFARYGVIPAACQKLANPDFIDIAELSQSILAKLSEHHASASLILKSGGLAAVLMLLDFFPVDVQRKAATTAANCVRYIPSDQISLVFEVLDHLKNMLSHHDPFIVEKATLALSRISENLVGEREKLMKVATPDVLQQLARLISLSAVATPESMSSCNIAVRALATVCRAVPQLVETLLASSLHDILAQFISRQISGVKDRASKYFSIPTLFDAVALVTHLLPPPPNDLAAVLTVPEVGVDRLREDRLLFARKGNVASSTSTTDSSALDPRAEMFIGHPELFMNVAGALLPVLMRTHTSTVNGNVRIQSLAAICRAIYHMPAPVLELLLRDVPFSAFLAGLLGSKDLQTCSIALFMGNILMGKLPVIFTRYFVKEGVVAEVDNLLTYLATSPSTTTTNPEPTPLDENSSDEGSGDEADGVDGGEGEGEGEGDGDGEEGDDETKNITPTDESLPASATPNPRAKSLKDSVLEQAKSFKGAYFTGSSDSCVSDEVVALRASSSALSHVVSDYVATSTLDAATLSQLEEKLRAALGQIVAHLSAGPSTYEFVESGLTSSLLHYFTCTSMNDDGDNNSIRRRRRQRRVELFAEVFSSVVTTGDGGNSGNGNSNDNDTGEYTGGALLVRQLQQALDKCESLHVLLHSASLTSSLKYLTYPFRFQLQRHPAETSLPELGAGSISVDPLATMGGVRDFLHARLRRQPRSTATAIATSNAATTNASPANASSAPTTTPSPPVADTQAMDVDMDDNNDDGDVDGVDKKAEESSKASDDIDMAEGNEIVEENDDAGDDDELDDLLGVISPALADMEEERSTTGGTMEADIHEIQLSEQQQEDESTVPAPHLAPTPASSAAGAGLWPAETTVDASSSYSVGDIVFLFKNRELKDSDSSFQVAASIGIENGKIQVDTPQALTRLWDDTYTIEYCLRDTASRLTTSVAPTNSSTSAPRFSSPSKDHSLLAGDEHGAIEVDRVILSAASTAMRLTATSEFERVVALLDILYAINNSNVVEHDGLPSFSSSLSSPSSSVRQRHLVGNKEFECGKIAQKLLRQLQDTLTLCSGALPAWCATLTHNNKWMFPFELRQLYFRSTSFGISRALVALQEYQQQDSGGNSSSSSGSGEPQLRIGRPPRQKFRISRDRVLECAQQVMEKVVESASSTTGSGGGGPKAILEIEYFNEVGVGLGPTLEFYTLVCQHIQRADNNAWVDNPSSPSSSPSSARLVECPGGLWPKPLSSASINTPGSQKTLQFFTFLGRFVAKAVMDNRLLDIPFSIAFLKWMLGVPLCIDDLRGVYPEIVRTVKELLDIVHEKNDVMSNNSNDNSSSNRDNQSLINDIKFRGSGRLEDAMLTFILPGREEWELVPDGANVFVNNSNVEQYVELLVGALLHDSVKHQLESFRAGFESLASMESLAVYFSDELDSLLCGSSQDSVAWDRATLLEHTKCDHGYTASSRAVHWVVDIIADFTPEERRKFLRFATGSSRLPPRGLRDMNPKLTFVRKEPTQPNASPDSYLPSVNTCFFYLKLPDYSSKEIMKQRLLFAITHGQDSFSFN